MVSKAINCLYAAFLCIAGSIITLLFSQMVYNNFLIPKTVKYINLVFSFNHIGIMNIARLTTLIFLDVLLAAICLAFILKTLQNFLLFIYYLLFYDISKIYKKLNIRINDNDEISGSFMELKNGKIIPVSINRLHVDLTEVKQINENSNEKA